MSAKISIVCVAAALATAGSVDAATCPITAQVSARPASVVLGEPMGKTSTRTTVRRKIAVALFRKIVAQHPRTRYARSMRQVLRDIDSPAGGAENHGDEDDGN